MTQSTFVDTAFVREPSSTHFKTHNCGPWSNIGQPACLCTGGKCGFLHVTSVFFHTGATFVAGLINIRCVTIGTARLSRSRCLSNLSCDREPFLLV